MLPNLVLGIARSYTLATIAPFVASLRRAAPAAELCLFAADMDAAFSRATATLGIRVEDPTPYDVLPYHPLISRLFVYDGFLRQHGDRYGNVLLTDVRDVVFQSDPFAPGRAADVLFAVEDGLLRDSPLNLHWIAGVHGRAAAEAIGDNPILCAGTTLGSVAGLRRYLSDMIQQIETMPYDRRVNYDQGMHNYLAWALRPPYAVADLERRVFRTIGLTPPECITLDDTTVTVAGRASPVLHQWDRHESLARLYATDARFQLADAGPAGPARPLVAAAAAAAFAPELWRYLAEWHGITSMLDLGPGDGVAARFFHRLGVIAHGIAAERDALARAGFPLALHDLAAGPYLMPVDLVWHGGALPAAPAAPATHLLDTLANARVIALAQADPGWAERLAARGYQPAADLAIARRIAANGAWPGPFATAGMLFVRRA